MAFVNYFFKMLADCNKNVLYLCPPQTGVLPWELKIGDKKIFEELGSQTK